MYDERSFGQRAKRTLTRLLVVAVILALGGAVAILLSNLNARTFTVEAQDGSLVVMKGKLFPLGNSPYRPADPPLAAAYAPFPLQGATPATLLARKFTDRDELDRALFEFLEQQAKPRIASEDSNVVEKGLESLRRAEKLPGVSVEQQRTLKAMQAEVAFYQARTRLEEARRLVAESLTQLRIAAEAQNRNARAAHQMITAVGPAAEALEESLRNAVHTLSAPADGPAEPPAPSPAPVDSKGHLP